jgi:glycosyltransferase involved in cell wall biosynthesis
MPIFFYCPNSFEDWDWRSPENPGIGGSETAVVELSRRLARRGHDVKVYTTIPRATSPDGQDDWRGGVLWNDIREPVNTRQSGLWIVCRSPGSADLFQPREDLRLWLQCQDTHYGEAPNVGAITPLRAAKYERILALCPTHRKWLLGHYPFLDDRKVACSSNGISSDRIDALAPIERDPFRLIWTSSPDRGLEHTMNVFVRAREFEPRLNLHIFYGWDNLEKVFKRNPHHLGIKLRERLMAMDQTNIFWRGRMGQSQLWEEYQRASFWMYVTVFTETSCITCMEAQALGAIPITAPIWALGHNVRHGVLIKGNASDPLTQTRYVQTLLNLVSDPERCERLRGEMMPWARERFSWERVVDDYERMIYEDAPVAVPA